jgi:hypothetical protein
MLERWEIEKQASEAVKEGSSAQAGAKCPYQKGSEPWRWSGWLAGHYDAHGLSAWQKARE